MVTEGEHHREAWGIANEVAFPELSMISSWLIPTGLSQSSAKTNASLGFRKTVDFVDAITLVLSDF
jgi:hypothetical protein